MLVFVFLRATHNRMLRMCMPACSKQNRKEIVIKWMGLHRPNLRYQPLLGRGFEFSSLDPSAECVDSESELDVDVLECDEPSSVPSWLPS